MDDLDWVHPGPVELATVAEFKRSDEQKELHGVFSRPADFDPKLGKFVSPRSYK